MDPRQILERLVAFPTISSASNLDLIDWVADLLTGFGADVTRVPDPGGEKQALYAHIGPRVPGAVVLSGHSDVVPVDGQSWTSDPFVLTERDGRLYGRGTCDMKGFVALALWAMGQGARAPLKRPLQLALSFDEELGCTGAPLLLAHMANSGLPKGRDVLVGEPSMMQVVTGHKGIAGYDIHVRGHSVHSSLLPDGVSAIMQAARLIAWANQCNAENAAAPGAPGFVPPYTTLHTGMIRGGSAHNITARDCWFDMEFRPVPGERAEDWRDALMAQAARIEAEMQAVHPDCAITLREIFMVPPLAPEPDGQAESLARRLTGDNATHVVSYATEAGQFQQAGYSAVVCGPGDIAQAHQADEFLSLAQLDQGRAFMDRLIAHLQE